MKSDTSSTLESTNKVNETVYKVQTFTERISAEKVKQCVEKEVLKIFKPVDYTSEK